MAHTTPPPEQWSEQVFGQAELGDRRRTQRLVKIGAMLASHTGDSALAASEGDSALSEGAYRLFRNDAVDTNAIAKSGFAATAKSVTDYAELLAVEDTTTLAYTHTATKELGDMGGKAGSKNRGFHVHSVLLVAQQTECTVGLIAQQRWCRDRAKRGQRNQNKYRAYEDKESYKWQNASEQMTQRLGDNMSRLISVCDREADVYEYLMYKIEARQRYIVRACHDRRLDDEKENLFANVAQTESLGQHTLKIAQRGGVHGRTARDVRLTLHSQSATLHRPERKGGHKA